MKKFVIIMIVAVFVSSAIFAADIQVGVMQNLINTSILVDTEFENFGFEGAIGTPAIWYAIGGINALANGSSDSGSESGSSDSGFAVIAGAMANVYYKVYSGDVFGFRLGLQADVLGLFDSSATRIMGMYGISNGFNFKFTDSFSMNFTATIPFALLLYPFGEAVTQYTAFYYNNAEVDNLGGALGEVFLAILQVGGTALNQVARLSFKWTV